MTIVQLGLYGNWQEEQSCPKKKIFFFLEQIQSGTKLKSKALKFLQWQRHLPDVAIQTLVDWLKDRDLCDLAIQILGIQAALPKKTIDYAIEMTMNQRSPYFSGYWRLLHQNSVWRRQDLHAEAIAKVWDYLEDAALRGVEISDEFLLDMSRTHLLKPDYVERLWKHPRMAPGYSI